MTGVIPGPGRTGSIVPPRPAVGRGSGAAWYAALPAPAGAGGFRDLSNELRSSPEKTRQHRIPVDVPGTKRHPVLVVLRGPQAGMRVPLQRERLTVGRSFQTDVILTDERISRLHAEIWPPHLGGEFTIVDLGSTNGTYVNGRPVRKARLLDGDKISLGSTILKFVIEDRVESESGALIERLMFEDDLTGLAVPRRFDHDLRVQIQSARSTGRALSVLMMDLDDLKRINDRHGHSAGGFVISRVGRRIGEICDPLGCACRCGGDEFVAYLSGADEPHALEVGERVRRAVRDCALEWEGNPLRVSISIGVATLGHAEDAEALTRAADEALYRAKRGGRDRVSA